MSHKTTSFSYTIIINMSQKTTSFPYSNNINTSHIKTTNISYITRLTCHIISTIDMAYINSSNLYISTDNMSPIKFYIHQQYQRGRYEIAGSSYIITMKKRLVTNIAKFTESSRTSLYLGTSCAMH